MRGEKFGSLNERVAQAIQHADNPGWFWFDLLDHQKNHYRRLAEAASSAHEAAASGRGDQ